MERKIVKLVQLGRKLYTDTTSGRKMDRAHNRVQKLAKKLTDEQLLQLLSHEEDVVRMAVCISLYGRRNDDIVPVLRELGSGEPIPWPDDESQVQRVSELNTLRMDAKMMLGALSGGFDELARNAELERLKG